MLVGRAQLLAERSADLPADLARARAEAESAGRTAVCVAVRGEAVGLVLVADQVKPSSPEAVAQLRELGLLPVLFLLWRRNVG